MLGTCKPTGRTKLTRWFSPEVHLVATKLHPRCVNQHLVVRRLRGVIRTSSPLGHRKNLPTSEVAQWHARSNRVALRDPHELSTDRTISLRASMESQATKPSRRWQHPRVTSTTGLQHEYLVPLDAISQCNTLEHSLAIDSHSCKHKWVRGFSSTPQAWTLSPKGAQHWPRPATTSIYSPRAKLAVAPSLGRRRGHRTHCRVPPDAQPQRPVLSR